MDGKVKGIPSMLAVMILMKGIERGKDLRVTLGKRDRLFIKQTLLRKLIILYGY